MSGGEVPQTTEWCLLGARLLMASPRKFNEFMELLREHVEFHELLGKRWKIRSSLDLDLPRDS